MNKFKVCGPYKVDLKKVTYSYYRLNSAQRELWKETKNEIDDGLRQRKGCYIFTNSNLMPLYVGKTDNCFGEECFTEHKQYLINDFIKSNGIDQKIINIFFIYYTGKTDAKKYTSVEVCRDIDTMETELIRKAAKLNKNLLNTRKVKPAYKIENEDVLASTVFLKQRRTRKKK